MLNKILFVTLSVLMLLSIFSCDRENYDVTVSTEEEVIVETTVLPAGAMEFEIVGIDTITVFSDTIYCDQVNTTVSFFPYTDISVSLKFHSDTNPDLLEIADYELIEIEVLEYTNQWEVLWTSTEIDGTVEITESLQAIDPFFQVNTNLISGFINGTLTDNNGVERTFSASFHRINRYIL